MRLVKNAIWTFATAIFLPALPAQADLVAHWALDDGLADSASLTAADSVSTEAFPAANGALTLFETPRWMAGVSGGAVEFGGAGTSVPASPGIDDVITMNASKLDITGALTISAWVKYNPLLAGRPSTRHIAGKDKAGGATGDAYSLKLDMTGNVNKLQFLIGAGANVDLTSTKTLTEYAAASTHDGWVHVVGVFEPGLSRSLYIDGVLDVQNTTNVPNAIDAKPDTPFNIGRLDNSVNHSFTGGIDDVRLYNTALSEAEVLSLFNAFPPTATFAPGDFNKDGFVDGADLGKWQGDFGQTAGSDADGDEDSDGADFLIWQQNYSPATPLVSAVPEPTGLMLTLSALMGLAIPRRQSRS